MARAIVLTSAVILATLTVALILTHPWVHPASTGQSLATMCNVWKQLPATIRPSLPNGVHCP